MSELAIEVSDVGEQTLPAAKAFLELYPETSLFLLSNIRAFGTRLGESLYSGNLKALRQDGQLRGIFCVTRGGSLLAQTGGDAQFVPTIVQACREELIPIRGVLGEWTVTKAIWDVLCRDGLKPTFESKEIMYRVDLRRPLPAFGDHASAVRLLRPEDHVQWEQLTSEFLREVGLPVQGTEDQRKSGFVRSVGLDHWWGAFEGSRLVSLVGITAMHQTIAQIGGVFTVPDHRRTGLSRDVMVTLMRDAHDIQGIDRLFLFTGEENAAARGMYESLGFESFGHFGLFFGDEPARGRG
jgi:RimJ/RimL family protein N-acetyltransferase